MRGSIRRCGVEDHWFIIFSMTSEGPSPSPLWIPHRLTVWSVLSGVSLGLSARVTCHAMRSCVIQLNVNRQWHARNSIRRAKQQSNHFEPFWRFDPRDVKIWFETLRFDLKNSWITRGHRQLGELHATVKALYCFACMWLTYSIAVTDRDHTDRLHMYITCFCCFEKSANKICQV